MNSWLANNTHRKETGFFNRDLGEKTGCAGNVVWAYGEVQECPLYKELLEPLAKVMKREVQYGPVDVNAIIERESRPPIFLEFYTTAWVRCNLCVAIWYYLIVIWRRLFADMAMGRRWKVETFKSQTVFVGALRDTHSTIPRGRGRDRQQKVVPDLCQLLDMLNTSVRKSVSPCEIRLDSNGDPECSGPNGCVFVLSNDGGTPKETMLKCEPDKLLKVPMMRYRTDLPELLQEIFDLTSLIANRMGREGPFTPSVWGQR